MTSEQICETCGVVDEGPITERCPDTLPASRYVTPSDVATSYSEEDAQEMRGWGWHDDMAVAEATDRSGGE